MRSAVASRRRPWLAAVLGFVVPGVGFLYAGRGRLAVLLLLLLPAVEGGVFVLTVVVAVPLVNLLIPAVLTLALRALLAHGAARAVSGFSADRRVPFFSRWYSCLLAVALAGGLNLLWVHGYRAAFVKAYKILTRSMEPTLAIGDRLLVVKWSYGWREPLLGRVIFGAGHPKRGELVVFRFPEDRSRAFLKRCIGLPGETVEIRDKKVFIGGKPLDEPYAHFLEPTVSRDNREQALRVDPGDNWGPGVVPPNAYFVLGDNRDNSRDSRFWGFVEQDDLLGRASVVYWSWDPRRRKVRWERIGRRLE